MNLADTTVQMHVQDVQNADVIQLFTGFLQKNLFSVLLILNPLKVLQILEPGTVQIHLRVFFLPKALLHKCLKFDS